MLLHCYIAKPNTAAIFTCLATKLTYQQDYWFINANSKTKCSVKFNLRLTEIFKSNKTLLICYNCKLQPHNFVSLHYNIVIQKAPACTTMQIRNQFPSSVFLTDNKFGQINLSTVSLLQGKPHQHSIVALLI